MKNQSSSSSSYYDSSSSSSDSDSDSDSLKRADIRKSSVKINNNGEGIIKSPPDEEEIKNCDKEDEYYNKDISICPDPLAV